MKSYLLLRDNQESGPYTLDEIRKKNLHSMDLIWVEGESKAWRYPSEINELRSSAISKGKKQDSKAIPKTSFSSHAVIVRANQSHSKNTEQEPDARNAANSSFLYEDVAKELFTEARFEHRAVKRSFAVNRNVMGLVLIFIGVIMGSFVVKNIVESFGADTPPSEQAREIQSMNYQSDNAAYAPGQVSEKQTIVASAKPIKNDSVKKAKIQPAATTITQTALVTTPAPEENSLAFASGKTDASVALPNVPEKTVEQKDASVTQPNSDNDKTPDAAKKDDKGKDVKKVKDIKSLVHASANNYKVGFLGGISDLEVKVSNDSPVAVDKTTVQVDFLKPNGSVVKSETIEISNIAPGKSKKAQVPSSGRGTKVQLHVSSVVSHEADAS